MPESISIQNQTIELGEQRSIYLNIARLPTYTSIDLPVHFYRGKEDGPVLLLTGGLHGDEINGIEIIRRMIANKSIIPDKGTIIAIPLVNIYGFIQNVRGVPDGKDINRSFPGVKTGSLARIVAYTLMNKIIPLIDYGLDFHTGGANRSNYPQIRCDLNIDKNKELAHAFAPPFVIHSKLLDKSFRKAAHNKGKHILVYEAGESMRYDENGINEGIAGTHRLMKYLGMREEAPEPYDPHTLMKTTWVRAHYAGLFQHRISLGDEVRRNQLLGYITDPFGSEQFKVKANRAGFVIGLNYTPVVHKGDALMHLGYNPQ
jgi:predicted deacylase